MKDILPFYTQDGSIGLYSKVDNDIFHSVYGAYSEAYDKFIVPANFDKFFQNNREIKILDICYGIGYNTKSFLNYFLENIFQKKFKNINPLTKNNVPIHTDNNLINTYNDKIYTNNILTNTCNSPIDTNNKINKNSACESKNLKNFSNVSYSEDKNGDIDDNKVLKCGSSNIIVENNLGYKVSIDAVDINETLMKASPLLKYKPNTWFKKRTGIEKVDKYLVQKSPNNHKYKMSEEVNYIIAMNLAKQYGEKYFSEDLKNLLYDKKYARYFDKSMCHFMADLKKWGYKYTPIDNKMSFLHNIYYRYISKGYKNSLKVLENNEISIRYISNDARQFVKSSLKRYDFIFLDAFTVSTTPKLWTYDFFRQLYNCLSYDGMILTYSNSSAVRNAFLKNDFYVGKIFNKNENRYTGTIAAKNHDLIEYKLNNYEQGLLNTKAGIVYRDLDLNNSDEEILSRRKQDVQDSNLMSSTKYIKNFKENIDE